MKKTFLLLSLLWAGVISAQNVSIFMGGGISAYREPGDGMVLSSQTQVKINQFLYVAPSISYVRIFDTGQVEINYSDSYEVATNSFSGGKFHNSSFNLSLFSYFKPAALFNKPDIDFKMGIGYGVTYANSISYSLVNDEINWYVVKAIRYFHFTPRLSYTFKIKKKFMLNCVIGYDIATNYDEIAYLSLEFGLGI